MTFTCNSTLIFKWTSVKPKNICNLNFIYEETESSIKF